MKCHAWCCVPVNEAEHILDDPRSLTGNDTVRQQTLVVTAHVNEPLLWRGKTMDSQHHSSNGRLQLEYLLGTERIGESQHVQSLTSIMNTLVPQSQAAVLRADAVL